jgi:uncharacterized membrane protein
MTNVASSLKRMAVVALVVLIFLGVFFRLFHADWKLYSFDETATSMRVSGHTFADFETFIHNGRTHRVQDLGRFQTIDSATGSAAVWRSLAAEDPQHPPLYFMLSRYAEEATGDSVFFRRLPAIIFGLLSLIAAWWFAQELFQDRIVALCYAGLVAVAPFHVIYAQQAREYSLWTLLICVSSALLLRSIRTDRPILLIGYAAIASLGLWSFTLFALALLAHAIYVFLPWSGASSRIRTFAVAAMTASVVSFIPWITVLVSRSGVAQNDTTWSAAPLSPLLFAGKWFFNASTVFFDLDYLSLLLSPIAVLLLAIAAWCCFIFARRASARIGSFVLLLGGVDAAAFLIPDILLHQTHSVQSRYLTPLWLAIELATAFGLVAGWRLSRRRARIAWGLAAFSIFAGGVASCAVSSFAYSWWLASNEKTLPAVAAEIARQTDPTLVYVDDDDELLELAASRNLSVSFNLHHVLDAAAIGSAAHPFVLTREELLQASPIAGRLRPVPPIDLFPSGTDPAITLLRHRAADDRRNVLSGNLALFSVK